MRGLGGRGARTDAPFSQTINSGFVPYSDKKSLAPPAALEVGLHAGRSTARTTVIVPFASQMHPIFGMHSSMSPINQLKIRCNFWISAGIVFYDAKDGSGVKRNRAPGLREPLADIAAAPVIDRIRLMTKVRILVSFGKLREIPQCARVSSVLEEMTFELPKVRTEFLTAEQAVAIRDRRDRTTTAQAFAYELMLRQKDVIGEWARFRAPKLSPTWWPATASG